MFLGAPILLLLAAAPAEEPPQGVAVTTSMVAERVPLPPTRGPVKVLVDSLAAKVQVIAPRDAAAVAARIAAHAAWICPKTIDRPDGIELRCRTRHLEAAITRDRGNQYLDLRVLRGLPWRAGGDGPPFFLYDPNLIGMGKPCPGNTPGGNGECTLQTGTLLAAARFFRAALRTPDRQVAALRLGDLALATGDPVTAIGWYRRAGTLGVFGRVARTRLCEIDGTCLATTAALKQLFDPSGLPAPVRREMAMRTVRAEVYQDRFASALTLLADGIRSEGYGNLCRDNIDRLCRRILLEIMRAGPIRDGRPITAPLPAGDGKVAGDDPASPAEKKEQRALGERALALYLELPGWDRGAYAVELGAAAADMAESFGAPVFAARILSAVGPMVPSADLPEHLARVAELFLRGGDVTRAKLVIEYATVVARRQMQTPRWKATLKDLAGLEADAAVQAELATLDPKAVAQETAAARAASNQARDLLKKVETAAGGKGSAP